MEFKELIKKAKEIQLAYKNLNKNSGIKQWTIAEYAQGFMGDVGDLTKLIMAKNNYRTIEDIDKKLAHELADCLWSIIIISGELGIDLEAEFVSTMNELEKKFKQAT